MFLQTFTLVLVFFLVLTWLASPASGTTTEPTPEPSTSIGDAVVINEPGDEPTIITDPPEAFEDGVEAQTAEAGPWSWERHRFSRNLRLYNGDPAVSFDRFTSFSTRDVRTTMDDFRPCVGYYGCTVRVSLQWQNPWDYTWGEQYRAVIHPDGGVQTWGDGYMDGHARWVVENLRSGQWRVMVRTYNSYGSYLHVDKAEVELRNW